jgi:hypothetical protein
VNKRKSNKSEKAKFKDHPKLLPNFGPPFPIIGVTK